MRTLLLLCVVALPATLPAQDKPADLLARMEQPILKAKSLQTSLEIAAVSGKDTILSMKGRLVIAQGNKARLELEGDVKGKQDKILLVADGTKQRMTSSDRPGKNQEVKKHLSEAALASVSRGGVFVSLFRVAPQASDQKPADFDLEKDLAVSDVKLGKKEAVSGKEAQAVEYKLTPKGAKEPLAVTVWIDPKTNLPVKRVVTVKEGEETITVTETYGTVVLNGKIDDKEFQVPK